MKWFGPFFVGGLILIGGGYWWWSTHPAEPLAFENTRSLTLEKKDNVVLFGETEEKLPAKALAPQPVPVESHQETPSTSSQSTESITIISRLVSFGFRTPPSPRTINTVVVHSSYNASGGDPYNLDKVIGQYEQYGVGTHYIIDRGGKIYQLVRESNIAYHAGESKMPDGRKNVNDFSVGIELIGTEDSGFTEKQYSALNDLIADIKTRYKIKDIVGHSDIAPTRKTDPWKFDWKKLN